LPNVEGWDNVSFDGTPLRSSGSINEAHSDLGAYLDPLDPLERYLLESTGFSILKSVLLERMMGFVIGSGS
jgi:hypothetical protein